MPLEFQPSAESVGDFFSNPGRGFYIPVYQRPYSWDEDNARQLASDLIEGMKRVRDNRVNTVFLGTIILHDQKSIESGVHVDTTNLVTKISNVVDGQQRISSIAIFASILSFKIKTFADEHSLTLRTGIRGEELVTQLLDTAELLKDLYSLEIKKSGSEPPLKPIVIRAVRSEIPAVDQWTLKGDTEHFYKSPVTSYIARCIEGEAPELIETDERLDAVVKSFIDSIDELVRHSNIDFVEDLVSCSEDGSSTLSSFLDCPLTTEDLSTQPEAVNDAVAAAVSLLAVSHFLRNGCHLVVIACSSENLAFDMFQSLNATGTPLTAFEVFKPRLVSAWGKDYSRDCEPTVARLEEVLNSESDSGKKEKLTDDIVCNSALIFNGSRVERRFSAERDFLVQSTREAPDMQLVETLADYAQYHEKCIRPRKPNKDTVPPLYRVFEHLDLKPDDASLAALCVYFLRDAKNTLAHPVLSLFYSKLANAKRSGDETVVKQAASDFLEVCKATAAFFTLYMGSGRGRFPDDDYRSLFSNSIDNLSTISGKDNRNPDFLKRRFREFLASPKIDCYDEGCANSAKVKWVNLAKGNSWYQRRIVCRFALFVAAHNAMPATAPSARGLYVDGQPGAGEMLSARKWYSSEYEVVEHVATREEPKNKQFPSFFDESVYPGNYSVVDQLGNLTLLSGPINSSIGSEWPHKVFYFWSLTQPGSAVVGPDAEVLKKSLGLDSVPPALEEMQASSSYLHHLAPLADRGINGERWDKTFIEARSLHLCERVFDVLDSWLR